MSSHGLNDKLCMNGRGSTSGNESTAKLPRIANIMDLLVAEGGYKLFVLALKNTGLDERLRNAGPYTVFAPTDEAFRCVPKLAELLKHTERLRAVIKRHIVWGDLDVQALWGKEVLTPLAGESLRIARKTFRIEDTEVVQPDLLAPNGKIHGVNRLFLDENVSLTQAPSGSAKA